MEAQGVKFRSRPVSAYLLWFSKNRRQVAAENPDMNFSAISRRMGELWRSLPEDEKMVWRKKAKKNAMREYSLLRKLQIPEQGNDVLLLNNQLVHGAPGNPKIPVTNSCDMSIYCKAFEESQRAAYPLQMENEHSHHLPYSQMPSVSSSQQQLPLQIINSFSMQSAFPNIYFNPNSFLRPPSGIPPSLGSREDEVMDHMALPLECVLNENSDSCMPISKEAKLSQLVFIPPEKSSSVSSEVAAVPVQCSDSLLAARTTVERPSPDTTHNNVTSSSSHQIKKEIFIDEVSEDEDYCNLPLSSLIGHPNDQVLRQQIYDIVKNASLENTTMNDVINRIYKMYPKYDLSYRRQFIKSTLRSVIAGGVN